MAQMKHFSFGCDKVTFISDVGSVYGLDDPQSCSINLTYERTEHRGGSNNDVRASAIHSRNGEITIGTGYTDLGLAQLLTGGTITSLGTSAASIVTGTASGVNTYYGSTSTIVTGLSTVTINSPTLVKSSLYLIRATDNDKVTVTRLEDGKEFTEVTLTNSATDFNLDSERGIILSTTAAATSLTINEVAKIDARSAINTINAKIAFDSNKPTKVEMYATIDYNGYRRTIHVPVIQPTGTIQGQGATEFQVQDLTMSLENSTVLNELADIVLQG